MTPDQLQLIKGFLSRYPDIVPVFIAKYFKLYFMAGMVGMTPREVNQVAFIGIAKAAQKFDPTLGKFDRLAIDYARSYLGNFITRSGFAKLARVGKYEFSSSNDGIREPDIPTVEVFRCDARWNGRKKTLFTKERHEFNDVQEDHLNMVFAALDQWVQEKPQAVRNRECLLRYYGMKGFERENLIKLANRYGVSKSRMSQIIEHSIGIIRRYVWKAKWHYDHPETPIPERETT